MRVAARSYPPSQESAAIAAKPKPTPKPKAPAGAGVQSFIQSYLAGLTKGPAVPPPPNFSSPAFTGAVDAGVNAQTQPVVDAIKQQQGHEKFLYDQETENAKGYSEGLAKILTGGNTNDAGMQYSKDNYGGSYLGAIASQQGGQLLAKITQDFNNNDWQLASKLADAMAQVPAIRDKVTSDLMGQANDQYGQQYKSAQDDFQNRIKIAGLIINQSNTAFNQQRLTNNDKFNQARLINNDAFNQTKAIDQSKQGWQRIQNTQTAQQNLQAYRQTQNDFKREGLILKQNAQTKALQDSITKGQLPNAAWSKIYGHIVDNNGQAILGTDGKPIPIAATKKSAKVATLTPLQINELRGDAATIADGAFNGLPKTNTLPAVPPANFGQALSEMRKGAGHGSIPLPFALKALQQAGFKVPAKYNRYLGVAVPGDPLGGSKAAPSADWRVALNPEGAGGVWTPEWNQLLSSSARISVARQALQAVNPRLASPGNVTALVGRMNQESGGNTAIVNKWDSNWKKGIPSIGLLQTVGPTFDAYKLPGHTNIWDPLDNTIAAVRYMVANYGRIVGPSGTGY